MQDARRGPSERLITNLADLLSQTTECTCKRPETYIKWPRASPLQINCQTLGPNDTFATIELPIRNAQGLPAPETAKAARFKGDCGSERTVMQGGTIHFAKDSLLHIEGVVEFENITFSGVIPLLLVCI